MRKRRTVITQDIIDKILELENQDVNISEIARQLHIDRRSVYRYIQKYVPEREFHKAAEVTEEELAQVRTMYLEQGMTPTEIAWKLGVTPRRIHGILTRYEMRKPKCGHLETKEFIGKMPDPVDDPVYYPERKITKKTVNVNGKKYTDVSEFYGL